MRTIGSYDAKTHLPRLLEQVAKGAQFTITKHGVPIAMLVPARLLERRDPRKVIEELRALRRGIPLRGLSLRKMINEGRRF